ncbi:hypothetical protein L0F63_005993 [Massospora cicadina]|nr:hypothetical protein L0F63_005993 [Massospora cicadina]
MLSEEPNFAALGSIYDRGGVSHSGRLPIRDIFVSLSSRAASEGALEPQLLLLLRGYTEENPDLELNREELTVLLAELTSSLSLRLISRSLPEPPVEVGYFGFKDAPTTPSKRRSLLATRCRTTPLPEPLEFERKREFGFELKSLASPIPRVRSTTSFRSLKQGFASRDSSPAPGSSYSSNGAYHPKRMSVGFEPSQADPSPASERTVRKFTSELSRKLASEKQHFFTLAQETQLRVSELETANGVLEGKVQALNKTVGDLKRANRHQDKAISALEEEAAALLEREAHLKNEATELKRQVQAKAWLERKLNKELDDAQRRLAEADGQIRRLAGTQKLLMQEKSKLKQMLNRLKRDNDRLGFELQQKELLYLDKINRAENQGASEVRGKWPDSDGSVPSFTSPLLEPARPTLKANPFRSPLPSRKRVKPPQTATIRRRLELKDTLESMVGLWEEAKDILANVPNERVQQLRNRLEAIRGQLKLEAHTGGGSPKTVRAKRLAQDYPVLSARRGLSGRPTARRGSSANASPKRLSVLLPPSRLHHEHLPKEPEDAPLKEASPPPGEPIPTDAVNSERWGGRKFLSTLLFLIRKILYEPPAPYRRLYRVPISTLEETRPGVIPQTSRIILRVMRGQDGAQPYRLTRHERSVSAFAAAPKIPGYIHNSFKRKGIARKNYALGARNSRGLDADPKPLPSGPGVDGNRLSGVRCQPETCKACGQLLSDPTYPSESDPGAPAAAVTCTDAEIKPILLGPSVAFGATLALKHLLCPPALTLPKASMDMSRANVREYPQAPSLGSSDAAARKFKATGAFKAAHLTSGVIVPTRPLSSTYEFITLRGERAAPCPPGWTRDDDDFIYEAATYKPFFAPCPHAGSLIPHSGKFQAYRYSLA